VTDVIDGVVYRLKAVLESEDGETWRVKKADYLIESRPGLESEFMEPSQCEGWKLLLVE
jgi:hypothetical protein